MTKAMIQANLHYVDITQKFKQFKDNQFKRLYRRSVVFQSSEAHFFLYLSCMPIARGININWLKYENDHKHYQLFLEAQKLYDFLVQKYEVSDPDQLRSMIIRKNRKLKIQVSVMEYIPVRK